MKEILSAVICKTLIDDGLRHVFFVPGLQVEPFLSIIAETELRLVLANHEMAAGYMADGYARVSGGMGVCIGIGGPGANNMIAAATIARVDEVSVLFITGDVPTKQKDMLSFQDTGFHGSRDRLLFEQAAGYSGLIHHENDLLQVLMAVRMRMKSNKPAHIVIPYDIQTKPVEKFLAIEENFENDNADEEEYIDSIALHLAETIASANKPAILIGHRIFGQLDGDLLIKFAERTGVKVATTYRAKGFFPENHALSLKNYGFGGNKLALDFLHNQDCDLILLVGVNLSQRDTFNFDSALFRNNRKIIAINPKDGNSNLDKFPIEAYAANSIGQIFSKALATIPTKAITKSITVERSLTKPNLSGKHLKSDKYLSLDFAVKTIRAVMPEETMFFVDSGFHRIIGGTAWEVTKPGTFFTSDFQAPMGWAICAAIGGKLARPHAPAVVLTGDGCMRMHAIEIATAARYRVHVIYVVSNNASYSSITRRLPSEFQKKQFAQLAHINWVEFGRTLGAGGMVVADYESLLEALSSAKTSNGPYIIDLQTDPFEQIPSETCVTETVWPVI